MMKRKTKRALSMVLASSMMLSVSSYTAFAADYKDTVGHWSEKQVNLWSDYGVISGYDGLFRPDDSITRGEMAVIMDKVMKYQVKAENTFSDLDQNFYTDSVLKANQAGIMRGSDGAVRPKDNITREEASVLICQAFGIDPIETATSKFNDSDKVSTWAAGYVNALLQKGYISGKGDNNFDPQGNITRGEAVTMFNNIVKGFYHQAGTYTENITGNVVVNTPETVLKDMSVTGDIFVTQGVADGNLTLENVKAPTVIVRGGGVNSVKITGNSEIGTVKVEKQDGDVRVVTDGTAKVSNVYIKDGSKNSVLEGSMDKIQVDASNSTVKINNATIKELNVTKESAKVVLDEKSIVDKLTIAETAANASVEINGTAKAISVSAQNAAITTTKSAKSDTLTVTEKATNTKLELNGTITTVDTSAQGTSANVVADANITTIKVLEKAADAKLSVAGKVGTVAVDAPNVTTEVLKGGKVTNIESTATATGLTVKGSEEGAKVIVAKDVTGTIVNGKDVKGGETVTAGSGKATTIKIGGKDSKVDWGKTVTQGEVENPSGNQFVNPNNPNDEWNADDAMPQKAPEESWFTAESPTTPDNLDGKITLNSDDNDKYISKLEYKLVEVPSYVEAQPWDDYKDWQNATEEELPAGTYYIRFKKSGSYLVGKDLEFKIAPCELPNLVEVPNVKIEELIENGTSVDDILSIVQAVTDTNGVDITITEAGKERTVKIPGEYVKWTSVDSNYRPDYTDGTQDIKVIGEFNFDFSGDPPSQKITTVDGEEIELFDTKDVAKNGIIAEVTVNKNEDAGTLKSAIETINGYGDIKLPRWTDEEKTTSMLNEAIKNYIDTQILTDPKYDGITIELRDVAQDTPADDNNTIILNGDKGKVTGKVSIHLVLNNEDSDNSPIALETPNFEVEGITYEINITPSSGGTVDVVVTSNENQDPTVLEDGGIITTGGGFMAFKSSGSLNTLEDMVGSVTHIVFGNSGDINDNFAGSADSLTGYGFTIIDVSK